jgi:hypothetical protein
VIRRLKQLTNLGIRVGACVLVLGIDGYQLAREWKRERRTWR